MADPHLIGYFGRFGRNSGPILRNIVEVIDLWLGMLFVVWFFMHFYIDIWYIYY